MLVVKGVVVLLVNLECIGGDVHLGEADAQGLGLKTHGLSLRCVGGGRVGLRTGDAATADQYRNECMTDEANTMEFMSALLSREMSGLIELIRHACPPS